MSGRAKPRIPIIWLLVFLVIAVIVIAIIITSPKPPETTSSDQPVVAEQSAREETFRQMEEESGQAVLVEDTSLTKDEISIKDLRIDEPSFVVIHADDHGEPGDIIRTSSLVTEDTKDLVIPLLGSMAQKGVYYAVVYVDNGDGVFSIEDGPATDKGGNIVMMSFVISE